MNLEDGDEGRFRNAIEFSNDEIIDLEKYDKSLKKRKSKSVKKNFTKIRDKEILLKSDARKVERVGTKETKVEPCPGKISEVIHVF